jgi:hypothetical protein
MTRSKSLFGLQVKPPRSLVFAKQLAKHEIRRPLRVGLPNYVEMMRPDLRARLSNKYMAAIQPRVSAVQIARLLEPLDERFGAHIAAKTQPDIDDRLGGQPRDRRASDVFYLAINGHEHRAQAALLIVERNAPGLVVRRKTYRSVLKTEH